MVAHPLWERKVAGSNPVTPTERVGNESVLSFPASEGGVVGAERRIPRRGVVRTRSAEYPV